MMSTHELHKTNYYRLNSSIGLLVLFCVILYGLAIFQDYVYSKIQITGFYWTDTMLYNTFWLLFIAFIPLANFFYRKVQPKSLAQKTLYALGTGLVFGLLHIFLFTSFFILISHLIFPIPHRFPTILKHALSNQLHIAMVAYIISPFVFDYLRKRQLNKGLPLQKTMTTITVKNGIRRIKIDLSTVLYIKTDKPYSMIHATDQKFLHDASLKKLEKVLDAQTFLRVHRSVIINKNHLIELKSRKNGDYDGVLTNGESIRISRHYRQNWSELLNH